jgi:hypothetical protein
MPFAPEGACVLKHDRPQLFENSIEHEFRPAAGEKPRQFPFSRLNRLAPEIAAVDLQEIEGTERRGLIMPAIAEQIEIGEAVLTARNDLAADRTRSHPSALIARSMVGKRSPQSIPRRDRSRTRSPLRWANMRYPSCLISCSQSGADGGTGAEV